MERKEVSLTHTHTLEAGAHSHLFPAFNKQTNHVGHISFTNKQDSLNSKQHCSQIWHRILHLCKNTSQKNQKIKEAMWLLGQPLSLWLLWDFLTHVPPVSPLTAAWVDVNVPAGLAADPTDGSLAQWYYIVSSPSLFHHTPCPHTVVELILSSFPIIEWMLISRCLNLIYDPGFGVCVAAPPPSSLHIPSWLIHQLCLASSDLLQTTIRFTVITCILLQANYLCPRRRASDVLLMVSFRYS